jgi:alginate O-acetyltransferase complex protein AlgJ
MNTPSPEKSARKKWAAICLAVMFMSLLWLPTLDTFLHLDRTTEFNEKRLPASWPLYAPGWHGPKSYVSGLEAYFNDHFGFRRQLIHWQLDLQLAFFSGGQNQVLMGKDGCLFFNESGTHFVEDVRGAIPLSLPKLADFQHLQESRRDWLAQRGVRYIFVIAPNKQTIYPDKLPGWLKHTDRPTMMDQIFSYMRAHSDVLMPDLRPALRSARQVAPTYYTSDSHWNDFGGFIACEELAKILQGDTDSKPLGLDSFELTKAPMVRGDMATMLGVYIPEDEPQLVPKTNLPPLVKTVPHPEFLEPTAYTTNLFGKGVCVVFGDSFRGAFQPFLGYHFKSVGYFWAPGGFDTNIITGMNADVVISEIVERHIDVLVK